jgi:uncharacterized protein YegP (UPF0339 family)
MLNFIQNFIGKGKFEVSFNSKNEYYFKLRASNGEIILISESYKNRQGCDNGIQSVRENALLEENFDIRISNDNKRYFVLKAKNGEIIGTSEIYNSLSNVINGIESVKKFSQTQEVKFI